MIIYLYNIDVVIIFKYTIITININISPYYIRHLNDVLYIIKQYGALTMIMLVNIMTNIYQYYV